MLMACGDDELAVRVLPLCESTTVNAVRTSVESALTHFVYKGFTRATMALLERSDLKPAILDATNLYGEKPEAIARRKFASAPETCEKILQMITEYRRRLTV